MLYYRNMVRWAWLDRVLSGWLTTVFQYFDTVGWVIRPVKTISRITYIVLVQTLNPAYTIHLCRQLLLFLVCGRKDAFFNIDDCPFDVSSEPVFRWYFVGTFKLFWHSSLLCAVYRAMAEDLCSYPRKCVIVLTCWGSTAQQYYVDKVSLHAPVTFSKAWKWLATCVPLCNPWSGIESPPSHYTRVCIIIERHYSKQKHEI